MRSATAGALSLLAAIFIAVVPPIPATLASFASLTTSPSNTFTLLEVQPATLTAAASLAGGVVRLSWSASPTAATETVTYAVMRRPSGSGAFAQAAAVASGLTYDDTPPSDGSYDYELRTTVATFTRDSNIVSAVSDRTPPSVSVTCDGAACVTGWYRSSVTVVVTATDAGTGVQTVRTTLDGVTSNSGSATVTTIVSGDGSHAFSALAIDNADNVSATQTYSIAIDGTPPSPATGLIAAAGGVNGSVSLSWTAATDATSGVSGYTIRYAQATTCPAATVANYPSAMTVGPATSTTVSGLNPAKAYCFYLITSDNAGNQSSPSNVASAKAK